MKELKQVNAGQFISVALCKVWKVNELAVHCISFKDQIAQKP